MHYDVPVTFEANAGQADSRVKFLSRTAHSTMFLTPAEAVLALTDVANKTTVLRLSLVGANREPKLEGENKLATKSNYFIGNDSRQWHSGIDNFARVRYRDVYPGVDLVYYGTQGRLEHDFVVSPGGDPNAIRMHLGGTRSLQIDGDGNLVASVGRERIRFLKPHVYQDRDDARAEIAGAYILKGTHDATFHLGDYDRRLPLVIDPQIIYSTYLGGSGGNDGAVGIAVDSAGNAYVAGLTTSPNFPTTAGTIEPVANVFVASGDVFISKLDPTGSSLIYSTYFGGTSPEVQIGMAVDSGGNVYIAGVTTSTDFPITPGALQGSYDNSFVTKLNSSGSGLVYSTYFGGCSNAKVKAMTVDSSGSVYLAGDNADSCFPTTLGAFKASNSSTFNYSFVSKLDPSGRFLDYSTLVSNAFVQTHAVAVDGLGNAYVAGEADIGFPTTPGAFNTTGDDGFVLVLNPSGSGLVYSTFLSNDTARPYGIVVDANGNAFVAGIASPDYPTTPGAFQTVANNSFSNAFVTELNPTGSAVQYSTFLGDGSFSNLFTSFGASAKMPISLDGQGNVYVGGLAQSAPPLTSDGMQTGGAFVTVLNPTGSGLVYSTRLGGSGDDELQGLALDQSGNIYAAGQTNSSDFPVTRGAFQTSKAEQGPPQSPFLFHNAFITKISAPTTSLNTPASNPPNSPITVSLNSNTVQITFLGGVITAGQSSVSNLGSSCPAFPGDFQIGTPPVCYEIKTTAIYLGNVQVCITDPSVTSASVLLHFTGTWNPITTNVTGQTICGTDVSLSPFAIARRSQLPLTIAARDVSRQYGSPDPTPFAVSYNGFVGGDGPTSLSGQLSCLSNDTISSPVGSYVIDCSGSTLSSSKYAISYQPGTLTITPAPLTLSADNQNKAYGAPVPALTFSASGFVNGDTKASLATQPMLSTTATSASGVGTYPINISGAMDSNYMISYIPGTMIVNPAVLTITAKDASKILDSPNPSPLNFVAGGFVNGDSLSVLTSTPSCATTATAMSAVGSYPITCSGGSATNYTFAYVSGTLKILYSTAIGHMIQPPINGNGSSVFNQGRTVPAKLSVFDANGVSIGTPGVVTSFYLTGIVSGTVTTTVQDLVDTNNPDTSFRWDPTAQQWIFNITTGNLVAGNTYIYTISLNDGSTIAFQFGLR